MPLKTGKDKPIYFNLRKIKGRLETLETSLYNEEICFYLVDEIDISLTRQEFGVM